MTDTRETVATWLASAGKDIGKELLLGEDGHCTLQLEGDLECVVEVPEDSELVFIYLPLLRIPSDPDERIALLESGLELNLFSLATGGASVAYDPRTDHLVLTFAASAGQLDEASFKDVLGEMIDLGLQVHEKLAALMNSEATTALPVDPTQLT